MACKINKNVLIGIYVIGTLILGFIGWGIAWFTGGEESRSVLYASIGIVVGIIISVALWYGWGKENTRC